jgi:HNH endonuclease
MECSYDGCPRPARGGNTICKRHQHMEWLARQGECSLGHCDRKINAGGLCVTHYSRKRRDVPDWDAPIPRRMKRGPQCSQGKDCGEPVYARGLCRLHYQRIHVLGHADPGPVGLLKAAAGEGSKDGRGYRVITVDGQRYLEHRWVMEQMLGRPLEPDEEVHHKNRIRDDNDPSNLELWATPQPRGGRVADLVAFYVKRYPDEARRVLAQLED